MSSSINPLQAPKTRGVLGLVGRTRAENVNLQNCDAQNPAWLSFGRKGLFFDSFVRVKTKTYTRQRLRVGDVHKLQAMS